MIVSVVISAASVMLVAYSNEMIQYATKKDFVQNVVIAYYILCAVHCHFPPFYIGYECMQYASVNISNSSMLHLHHV